MRRLLALSVLGLALFPSGCAGGPTPTAVVPKVTAGSEAAAIPVAAASPPAKPKAPVVVPQSLTVGRQISYDSTGFGEGHVTKSYAITDAQPIDGGFQLTYTETTTGAGSPTSRDGFVRLNDRSFFDRGKGLSLDFLEPAGHESVTVPAGTFDAAKYTNKGTPKYSTFWVVNGVVIKAIQGDVGGNKPGTGQAALADLQ